MIYRIGYSSKAERDIELLKSSGDRSALLKLRKLLIELVEHPYTGTGQVEKLKYQKDNTWSRRINKEHRLVYNIYDDIVEVLVLSAYGHYLDK